VTAQNLDGFPDFDREPPTLPELPHTATPMQVARAYGSAVAAWYERLKNLAEAVYWLRGVFHALHGKVDAGFSGLDAKIGRVEAKLDAALEQRAPRKALPSFSDLEPEQTANGGVNISALAWSALQERVAEHDELLEAAEAAKVTAEARAQGASDALASIERQSDRRLKYLAAALGVLVAVGSILAWVLTHLRH